MNYLNITKYIYLILGFVMTYDAISKWNENPTISIIFAVAAFFMFFFRSNFAKKFEERKNQQQSNNSDK